MTLEYLRRVWERQHGRCPYTGWELLLPDSTRGWSGGKNTHNASLDRIDSKKGYVKRNVQFVAMPINTAKGDFSAKEFRELLAAIARHWR
jgi:hypothetical protein